MTRRQRLKVYGGLVFAGGGRQVRTIVAATSRVELMALVGLRRGDMAYWSETGNKVELETALAAPGVVFIATSSMGKDFSPRISAANAVLTGSD